MTEDHATKLRRGHIYELVQNADDWVLDHPLYANKYIHKEVLEYKLYSAWDNGLLHGAVVVDCTGKLQGALLVIKADDIFTDETHMYEMLFYVHPFYRSLYTAKTLLDITVMQARSIGAKTLQFGVTSGYQEERVGKLYKYLGFEKRGGTYVMEV